MVAGLIIVEDRLWGAVTAWTTRGPFLPVPPTGWPTLPIFWPRRWERPELGRAGCLEGADRHGRDDTRRQIERDLHDGTQQRLVSLGLELRLTQGMCACTSCQSWRQSSARSPMS